ncbi:ubiquinone-binding COQ10-like protein [Aspergillus undulatus]|uniref:ubiquinone-binding COQ10-like protein n=1 Tax=Aspergillus undulatus TaxID=1810928 RepID=UPI003CCCE772
MNRPISLRFLPQTPKPSLRTEPRTCRHFQTYYKPYPHLQRPQLNRRHPSPSHQNSRGQITQNRTFLSSFIPSPKASNNGNGNNNRTLTATRTLSYEPAPLFTVISSVESYSSFLPFLTASTVTARDEKTGLPSQAYLTVGYGPLSETFTSRVECRPEEGVVEARSGERYIDPAQAQSGSGSGSSESGLSALASLAKGAGFPGADEGIFEYLSTRWELVPEGKNRTTVKLEIRFAFKSQLYASMFSAVEGQMAGIMIEAFERRVGEVCGDGW